MKIKIKNTMPSAHVDVKVLDDGTALIEVSEKQLTLGDVKRGSKIRIGGREYIVLDHSKDTTAVITADAWRYMEFGNGVYAYSSIRNALNGEFYAELATAIGAKHIVEHTVHLKALDGTYLKGAPKRCKDRVSLLTLDQYRRYRKYLPSNAGGCKWWLATPYSNSFDSIACYVNSLGVPDYHGAYARRFAMRPFVVLDSSVANFTVVE